VYRSCDDSILRSTVTIVVLLLQGTMMFIEFMSKVNGRYWYAQ
jgi:hypothetical protein